MIGKGIFFYYINIYFIRGDNIKTYIVKAGDTLYGISNQFGVSVTELAEGIILMVILYLTIQLSNHSNLFSFGKKKAQAADEEEEAAA